MSNLSELLPTGGGQNSVDFVASGTLSSGQTVALKTDGTVEAVAETNISAAIGTQANAANVNSEDTAVVYDSATDKFTLFYVDRNNSDYGTYVVGTISGTSITFGTPAVFNSAAVTNIDAVYDEASGNIVIMWSQTGIGGRAIVGSRSGNTLTLGSAVTFDTNSVFGNGGTYIEDAEKVFIAYRRNSAGTGHGIVGTVSGTSISFGSATTMPSSVNPTRPTTVYVGSSKAVVATRDSNVSPTAGKAVVATISGTSVSFGSFTTFESSGYVGTGYMTDVTYDSANDKVVIGYPDGGNSDYGTAIVGTVSGTSISFGTAVVFASTNIRFYYSPTLRYSTKSGNVFTVYVDASNSDIGKYILGTVSGTSISFNTAATFNAEGTRWLSLAVNNTTNKFVVGYVDDPAAGDPSAQIIQDAYTSSNNTSFIGITAEAISSAATGAVNVYGGINAVQTGLTIASDYYVQTDGSLGSPTVSAPYVIVGATYVQNFSVATQETSPRAMAFNTDGTKMFVIGDVGDDVNEYALSTGFDVSTASYTQAFSIAAQETAPSGIAFNTDGTKMFVVGTTGDAVNEYALSTGFNVSTASFTDSFSVAPQEIKPQDVAFNTDGTKMFIVGDTGDDVNEYTLATGFDVSTSSFVDSFSVSAQEAAPQGVAFNPDGTKMFVVGNAAGEVHQYTLTTGFDVSTASYASINFSAAAQDTFPMGIAFNTDGTKMFIVGLENDAVYQYSTGVGSVTTVKAGQAISATTINLKDLT
jgi:hypothetical protein